MSILSWFHAPKHAASPVRQPSRRPLRSRPSLECLEERIVPDGASGTLNVVSTGAVNFQAGFTVVTNAPGTGDYNGIAVGVFSSALEASGALEVTQWGLGLSIDHPANPAGFSQNVFGFGSGTQPNRPWVPNAYNLGLANHQFAYPSMADHGYPAPGPWFHGAYRPPEEDADDYAIELIAEDEEGGVAVEEANDADDVLQALPLPLISHDATMTEETEETKDDADSSVAVDNWNDSENISYAKPIAGDEEAELSEIVSIRHRQDGEIVHRRSDWTQAANAHAGDLFVMEDGAEVIPALRGLDLSGTLVLSVLTPAQFMALVMEFPEANGREKEKQLSESA